MKIAPMPSTTVFILAFSVVNLAHGMAHRPEKGAPTFNLNESTKSPKLRNVRFLSDAAAKTVERHLLPHRPEDQEQDSEHYRGCLNLSQEERVAAWSSTFQGEAPPCTISVQGAVVAGGDGSTSGLSASANGDGSDSNASGSNGNGNGNVSGSESNGSESSSTKNSDNNVANSDVGGGSGGSTSGNDNSGSSGSTNGSGYNDGDSSNSNTASYGGDGSRNGADGWSENSSAGSSVSSSSNGDETSSNKNSDTSGSFGDSSYSSSGVDGEYDDEGSSRPLRYFNISDCGTYSNIWVWDLALTCENSTSLESCQCTEASILYDYGEFNCPGFSESPSCPSNCPVCNTCMRLLGCSSNNVQDGQRLPTAISSIADGSLALPIALGIAAGVVSVIIGYTMYQYKSRNIASGGLGANFIRDEPPMNSML